MRRLFASFALSLSLSLAAAGSAAAQEDGQAIVFTRGTSLWRIEGDGKPEKVVDLGGKAPDAGRIQVAPDGSTALVQVDGKPVWVDLEKREIARPECDGAALLSVDGRCLLCRRADGAAVLHRMAPTRKDKVLAGIRSSVDFLGGASSLAVVEGRGIWKVSVAHPKRHELLAPHIPELFSVSPDGHRAVASYAEKKRHVLYTFKLDGKGARRELMLEATPVGWSDDSHWVLVQAGNRGCVVRAVGGQYKCWDRFRVLSVDKAVTQVLLGRDGDLYRAPLAGARAAHPKMLQRHAPSAAWLP